MWQWLLIVRLGTLAYGYFADNRGVKCLGPKNAIDDDDRRWRDPLDKIIFVIVLFSEKPMFSRFDAIDRNCSILLLTSKTSIPA